MNKILNALTAVILITSAVTFSACKKTFDNPPGASDPALVANTTISALKALHTNAGAYDVITSDLIISGIVVADDRSGNLYKQLFIQDATGGLQILLDAVDLYNTYPVGRRIFIHCKDLCISDYNGLMELGVKATVAGLPSLEGIPSNAISKYVVGGSINNPVTPIVVNQSQLGTNMQDKYLGSLIQLDGYEFGDTTVTYSDTSTYKSTVNLDIRNCSGQSIIIRTSAYADFAAKKVAKGNGSVVAIYTTFGTTKQLLLRTEDDVKFTGFRCNLFEEFFTSLTSADNNQDFSFNGWSNIAPNSSAKWKNTVFGSTGRAVKVTAFGTGLTTDTAWMITPAIVLPAGSTPNLQFKTAYQFAVGPTKLQAYVSTNYTAGGDPNAATWTQLTTDSNIPGNTATNNSGSFSSLVSTGALSLSAYAGQTVFIAFKYMGGTSPAKTTNFEIDDITITRQ
ncbi:MAG: choice-of-anchor J domain-containing protein [Bacteroidetes bacterium]|nr:choice-of-anchor J domain-containing protein [Bacteroidota bacterium]